MAAFAYVLLPLSGMTAYFMGSSARARFHGMQAVLVGLVWPVALLVCSAISAVLTQVAFAAGTLLWLAMIVTTALGRDLKLPFVGAYCARVSGLEPPEGS